MNDPPPPPNDQPTSESEPTSRETSGGVLTGNVNKDGAFLVLLLPPFHASNLQRRAADVMRRRLRWSEGSPPGIYWNGDVDPHNPFLCMDGILRETDAEGPALDATAETSSDTRDSTVEWTSDDSSDSDTSMAGPPTPKSPRSSSMTPDTPVQIQEYDFSGIVKRRGAAGASQNRSNVQGQLIELGPESMHLMYRQGYLMELTIFQPTESDGHCEESLLKLSIDTGSNTTWILGDGYCQAEAVERYLLLSDRPRDIRLTRWPLNQPPRVHGTLAPNPFLRNPSDDGDILKHPDLPPVLWYSDKSLVVVEQLTEPLRFTVENFYNWNECRWNAPRTLGYRFAVAFAVDERTMRDPTDGILGLGPLRRQSAFESNIAEQDFSTVLTEQCVPLKGRTKAETYNSGHVYYFGLRPPPDIDISTDPSWMSVNQWPCNDIEFSPKIPVQCTSRAEDSDDSESDSEEAPPTFFHWSVKMKSMAFFRIVVEPDDAGILRRRRVPLCRLNFGERGATFALDTGSSTSEVPEGAHAQSPIQLFEWERNSEGRVTRPKILPAYCNGDGDDDVVVDFIFLGENQSEVTVTGPARPFICQDSRRDSLIFTTANPNESILGANFFQTMFVAMHRPDNSARYGPYVRLAPQWPHEAYRLRLPPKDERQDEDKGKEVEMDDELMDTDSELTDMEE